MGQGGGRGARAREEPVGGEGRLNERGPVGGEGPLNERGAVGGEGPAGGEGPLDERGPSAGRGPSAVRGPAGGEGPSGRARAGRAARAVDEAGRWAGAGAGGSLTRRGVEPTRRSGPLTRHRSSAGGSCAARWPFAGSASGRSRDLRRRRLSWSAAANASGTLFQTLLKAPEARLASPRGPFPRRRLRNRRGPRKVDAEAPQRVTLRPLLRRDERLPG